MAPRHSCHQIRFMLMCPCIINDLFENDGRCYRKLSCWTEQELTVRVQKSTYPPDSSALNLFFITNGFFKRSLKENQPDSSEHLLDWISECVFVSSYFKPSPTLTFALLDVVYQKPVLCILKPEPAPLWCLQSGPNPWSWWFWLRHMADCTLRTAARIQFHLTPWDDSKWNAVVPIVMSCTHQWLIELWWCSLHVYNIVETCAGSWQLYYSAPCSSDTVGLMQQERLWPILVIYYICAFTLHN